MSESATIWRTDEAVRAAAIAIERDGYAVIENAVDEATIGSLIEAVETATRTEENDRRHRRGDSVYALRHLLETVPAVARLAHSDLIRRWITPILGAQAFPVRGIWFDKTPDANWRVGWHQDITIVVRERCEAAGFNAWSVKDGVLHVQPPGSVLERMLTARVHLDDCGEANGCLRVLPGSHKWGRLPTDAIAELQLEARAVAVPVARGSILLMRPLLFHASSPARLPGHRRVAHLEYAARVLPDGLHWRNEEATEEEFSRVVR